MTNLEDKAWSACGARINKHIRLHVPIIVLAGILCSVFFANLPGTSLVQHPKPWMTDIHIGIESSLVKNKRCGEYKYLANIDKNKKFPVHCSRIPV